jgi:hypothetical protein
MWMFCLLGFYIVSFINMGSCCLYNFMGFSPHLTSIINTYACYCVLSHHSFPVTAVFHLCNHSSMVGYLVLEASCSFQVHPISILRDCNEVTARTDDSVCGSVEPCPRNFTCLNCGVREQRHQKWSAAWNPWNHTHAASDSHNFPTWLINLWLQLIPGPLIFQRNNTSNWNLQFMDQVNKTALSQPSSVRTWVVWDLVFRETA